MANKVGAVAGQVVESAIEEKLPVPALNHDGAIAKKNLEVGIFKFEEKRTKDISDDRLSDVLNETAKKVLNKIEIFKGITKKSDTAENYFKNAKSVLDGINDENIIGREIHNNIPSLVGIINFTTALELPYQICYGLMLNRLKEIIKQNKLGNFTEIVSPLLQGISIRTCQNYMLAAKIVDLVGMEKYYCAGITVIYKFMRLYGDNAFPHDTSDPVMHAFRQLFKNGFEDSHDYGRIVQYVVYLHKDILSLKVSVDYDLLYTLFLGGFDINKKDIANIKRYKDSYQNFTNLYLSELIKNDHNRERAIDAIVGANLQKKIQSKNISKLENAKNLLTKLDQLLDAEPSIIFDSHEKGIAKKVIVPLLGQVEGRVRIILNELEKELTRMELEKEHLEVDDCELAKIVQEKIGLALL